MKQSNIHLENFILEYCLIPYSGDHLHVTLCWRESSNYCMFNLKFYITGCYSANINRQKLNHNKYDILPFWDSDSHCVCWNLVHSSFLSSAHAQRELILILLPPERKLLWTYQRCTLEHTVRHKNVLKNSTKALSKKKISISTKHWGVKKAPISGTLSFERSYIQRRGYDASLSAGCRDDQISTSKV